MEEIESYSRAQRLAGWLGVVVAAGLLGICLDVATGGAFSSPARARYRWSVATSEESPGDD